MGFPQSPMSPTGYGGFDQSSISKSEFEFWGLLIVFIWYVLIRGYLTGGTYRGRFGLFIIVLILWTLIKAKAKK